MTEKGLKLRDEEGGDFCKATLVETFVEFAVVVAVGDVLLVYITVARFQHFVEGGFVDCAGANVVS